MLSASLVLPVVFAQNKPDAGVLLQQQQSFDRLPMLVPDAPVLLGEPQSQARRKGEATVFVKEFRFAGDLKSFSPEVLREQLQPYTQRALSLTELQQAAQEVTAYYRANGYFLAQAYLLRQDVTDGIVTLQVQEGMLDPNGGLQVRGADLRLNPAWAQEIVQQALSADPVLRLEMLERGVLLLNDLAGVSATANLEPGRTPGTTRIVVDVKDGPQATGLVTASNYGNRYIGRERVTGSVSLHDLNGQGDQLSLASTRGWHSDYEYAQISYALPLSADGWRLGLSVSDLRFGLGEELASQHTSGTARDYGVDLRYPLVRTSRYNVYANVGYNLKDFYNETAGTATSSKRFDVLNVGLNSDRADGWMGGGVTLAGVAVSLGQLDLTGNQSNWTSDQGATGPHTQGTYTKLGWNLARIQHVTRDLKVIAQLTGQFSDNNLDPAEKFQLGGPSGVRAYAAGEGLGDQGVRATLETRYRLGEDALFGDISLMGFYDWGAIQQYRNNQNLGITTPNRYDIAGYGVGLSVSKSAQHEMRVMWAQQAGSNPGLVNGKDSEGSDARRRLWVAVSKYF